MKYVLFAFGALFLLAGCTPQEEATSSNEQTLRVENAWVRPGHVDGMSALYFTVINDRGIPDTLGAILVPVAGRVEMHETRTEEGMSVMKPLRRVPIPPHGRVTFEPGGKHAMLLQLQRNLEVGDTLDVSLIFTQDTLRVKAPVREHL